MRRFPALLVPTLAVVAFALITAPVSGASRHPVATLATGGRLTGSNSVAVSGATVHAVYNRAGVITYERSTDAGRTFRPTTIVRSSGINSYTALGIAAFKDRVALLYGKVRSDTTTRTLYVKVSADAGRHWSGPTAVSGWSQSGGGFDAAVAVSSTNFYVAASTPSGYVTAWHTVDPTKKQWRGIDNGLGTTTNREIQNDPTHLTANVALAAWGDRVAVFWAPDGIADGTVGHIVMRRSLDAGVTWDPEQTIASDASVVVGARPAAVSAFSSTILVAYQRSDGKGAVTKVRDWGRALEPHSGTPAPTTSGNPEIDDVFVWSNVARLVYASRSSDGSIDKLWVRTSTDAGTSWGPPTLAVGASPTRKNFANIVSTSRGFVVVFSRYATPSGGVFTRAFT